MSEIILEESIPELSLGKRPRSRVYVSDKVYYGKPIGIVADKNIHEENLTSDVKIEQVFINNLPVDVTIMGRDGLAYSLRAKPDLANPRLIIRKIITLKSQSLKSAIKCLSSIEDVESTDLEVIKKSLEGTKPNDYNDIKIALDYIIDKDDIGSNKQKTIYHHQTDLVISLKDVLHIPNHPQSSRFLDVGAFGITHDYENIDRNNLQIKIKYVNHSPHASAKYVNAFGRIFCLHPEKIAKQRELKIYGVNKKKDLILSDYLEVIYTLINDDKFKSGTGLRVVRYTLEEAHDAMGLYDTYAEAESNGNIELVRKRELATLQHKYELDKQAHITAKAQFEEDSDNRKRELNIQALDLQREKNNQEIEKSRQEKVRLELDEKQRQLDVQISELKNTKTLLDMRANFHNLNYEMAQKEFNYKAQKRKDTVDIIKFIPSLIVSVVGLVGLYAKFSEKSS